MRTRFTWIVGILVLAAIGLLMACSNKYTSTYNGLVVASTQGNAVMQSFSLNLGTGQTTTINNVNGPPTPGVATAVLIDPAGNYAYVIVTQSSTLPGSSTGIASFQIASDGKLAYVSTFAMTNPIAMAMDSAGQFLFVANGAEGTVTALSIGSGGTLTSAGLATLPPQPGGQPASASALAVTPTVFPVLYAPCSGHTAPTAEYLYVTDSLNNVLLDYSVSSSGALALVTTSPPLGIATGTLPSGVTVDPCNRFAYVANGLSASVSAYTIYTVVSLPNNCQNADYSLRPVIGSPYLAGDGAGPLVTDPYASFLYVLDTGKDAISAYQISAVSGALTPLPTQPVAANAFPTSMAVRSNKGSTSWLFVANSNQATISEYAITPATGALTPQPAIQSFNQPWGVAVK